MTIIGGAGRMGRWLAHYFSSRRHEVTVSDLNLDKAEALAEAIGGSREGRGPNCDFHPHTSYP
ncbi:MAG: NAD(P)-binding domain-containing protein [Candidatus Bathyarchaeia archaeon]